MLYKFWESSPGRSPVADEIEKGVQGDPNSFKKLEKALKRFEKYPYKDLSRSGQIEKLKGNNPHKLHEYRVSLDRKIGRFLFVVGVSEIVCILRFFIKKDHRISETDRTIASKRAELYSITTS